MPLGFSLCGKFARFIDRSPKCLCKIDSYRGGDTEKGFQGGIPHFTFNVTHHLLRQASAFGNRIHGESAFLSLLPQNSSDARANSLL
jgi:hypothetical protein